MILTVTKYHENLLRDSPLSLLFTVKLLSSLETKMILKIPNETFLRITRYVHRGSSKKWATMDSNQNKISIDYRSTHFTFAYGSMRERANDPASTPEPKVHELKEIHPVSLARL